MIPIDEQIAHEIEQFELHAQIHGEADPMMAAKIASLERLKAIDAVQVPEEPKCLEQYVRYYTKVSNGGVVQLSSTTLLEVLTYIDTLRDLLKRESADAKHYREKSDLLSDAAFHSEERAEAAEATIAAMLKLGEEPSEEMKKMVCHDFRVIHVFTSMFAKMVEQSKEKANG